MKKKLNKIIAFLVSLAFIVVFSWPVLFITADRKYALNYKDYFWVCAGIFSALWLFVLGSKPKLAQKHSLAFFLLPFFILSFLPFTGNKLGLFTNIEAFSWTVFVFCGWMISIGIFGILALFIYKK